MSGSDIRVSRTNGGSMRIVLQEVQDLPQAQFTTLTSTELYQLSAYRSCRFCYNSFGCDFELDGGFHSYYLCSSVQVKNSDYLDYRYRK